MSSLDEKLLGAEGTDFYHHGVITKLFPSNNTGVVRTESGREVPFSYDLVILYGELTSVQDLREGQAVGYDIGWTSSGLRITKIKTYSKTPSQSQQQS